MGKYALVREAVIARGLLTARTIEEPEPVNRTSLGLVHDQAYADAVIDGTLGAMALRRLGFPWSPRLPERSLRTVQGTLEALRDALETGAGLNLAGGTHHAFPDHGEGFCVFNDVAVAIRTLQLEGRILRAAVVDLDVHQGNGTARIFADDRDVVTFSMHGAKNYPFRKEASWRDVELADGCADAEYLALLDHHLDEVLDAAAPDLVTYIAGADPFFEDRLGRVSLSMEGLRQRDRRVFESCRRRHLPVAMVLGGGYARHLADVATIHGNSIEEFQAAYA